jgi:hypothetical protein
MSINFDDKPNYEPTPDTHVEPLGVATRAMTVPAQGSTVRVTVRRYHTLNGEEHHVDESYEAPADAVHNLISQGLVSED